ncbi:hypothetical protein TTHERM_000394669 (macronuclear) [Tetrahymena thermophila SB210]|uniref:Uncharacterized protein n=1 Tax=Tetrahymena thermophila (strain SB210) TaxID=312017 RepID=W7XD93_TETTS|nr:hypothetical protein TTHERM_000394669 [Tetrahymena thermophila SB210]EWS75482.1 hypothetical protein TTHERM_000394669 [Tetrahymena thermophila SB210]|eukprot:XP_012651951.1 hypothetical protein TTHERM_000394669 [Tetrahymena thermophila SB210]
MIISKRYNKQFNLRFSNLNQGKELIIFLYITTIRFCHQQFINFCSLHLLIQKEKQQSLISKFSSIISIYPSNLASNFHHISILNQINFFQYQLIIFLIPQMHIGRPSYLQMQRLTITNIKSYYKLDKSLNIFFIYNIIRKDNRNEQFVFIINTKHNQNEENIFLIKNKSKKMQFKIKNLSLIRFSYLQNLQISQFRQIFLNKKTSSQQINQKKKQILRTSEHICFNSYLSLASVLFSTCDQNRYKLLLMEISNCKY